MNHPDKTKGVAKIGCSQRQRDPWQPTGPCIFQQLPQALVMDILSRLSPNNLLSCRCVCKPWLFLISDPQFNRLRQSRSPMGILILTYTHRNWRLRKLHFTQIVDSTGPDLHLERMTFRPKISIPVLADQTSAYYNSGFGLINSCNGLLCLAEPNYRNRVYVCNPISGEFITTPPLVAIRSHSSYSFNGLGFSAATNEYKILITCLGDRVHIYTIGARVWRDIEKPPICSMQSPFNAFLHGALHWVSECWTSDDFMHSFNFETENFGTVPPPSHFTPNDGLTLCSLGVLEGCLLLCGYVGQSSKFEMWIMRDYGVQESWTKTFVIESLFPRMVYDPIMFLSNGEFLMSYGYSRPTRINGKYVLPYECFGAVICYNPESKSIRETGIAPAESQFVATGYSPSFISLHNIAKGEKVKRIRNNENFNKLFTEESSTAAGSRTSTHQCTILEPGSCPPVVEAAPCTPIVATSSATQIDRLDLALRIGTKCDVCAGQLGYVFRGKGFAMCQKCFDASSS